MCKLHYIRFLLSSSLQETFEWKTGLSFLVMVSDWSIFLKFTEKTVQFFSQKPRISDRFSAP